MTADAPVLYNTNLSKAQGLVPETLELLVVSETYFERRLFESEQKYDFLLGYPRVCPTSSARNRF